jgi:hypothetical protein
MIYLHLLPNLAGELQRQFGIDPTDEGVRLNFSMASRFSATNPYSARKQALQAAAECIVINKIDWIRPGPDKWFVDIDGLKTYFDVDALAELDWLKGTAEIEPVIEDGCVIFYVVPENIRRVSAKTPVPGEIHDSLARFQRDHPDPSKVAFIMMQYDDSRARSGIVRAIRDGFEAHGITALRADDKFYHEDLFPNVMTYMHGCSIGIALFERIQANDFNPNVSLEVGYMLALRKDLCFLKDKTLARLNSDLIGKLYNDFDTYDPQTGIPPQIEKWLKDRNLA